MMPAIRSIVGIFIAVALFAPHTVHGSDVNREPFRTFGEGGTTCGEFIAQPGIMQTVRMEWVLVYISGRNREAALPRERDIGTSFQQPATVIGWLQSYCRSHSLDTLISAADNLRA